ncbi:MAG: GH92 family glycosyl hydrolase [Prevotella sp.]|nr:GH92 family glycosyl hydrolase [Prevotella sp.]
MVKTYTLAFMLAFALSIGAQTFSPERTGGIYYAYPVSDEPSTFHSAKDFQPFYISHYGRHGSRWLPSEERYTWVMAWFEDKSKLTPLGKSVRQRLAKICRNAQGHAGELTPLGAKQHRGIARRMVQRFPEVFGSGVTQADTDGDTRIWARSSTSPRCRASMLAFCDELKAQPVVKGQSSVFNVETNAADMLYINNESAELKALTARTKVPIAVSTDRFLKALFKDPAAISPVDGLKLLSELHTIASDMQDVPLDISLWDCFTPEEMLAVHDANNERMTICNGDTIVNDGIAARSSIALWQNIVEEADNMIASGGHGALLRFGHDTALFRLLTLIGLQLPGTGMEDIVPMAANLQMVFFRDEKQGASGKRNNSVVVAFLLNEQPCPLRGHLSPLVSHPFPLYGWEDVKEALAQRIHYLGHLQQLTALNTMVGTAPANTKTAGLFGKGSEEHGQTLPAVLVPNGQTFWTPQTQATEKKCVAPYYYQDTLFQGIRASHWLVGGCTQDYGSFTVKAYGSYGSYGSHGAHKSYESYDGTLFSHSDETSHPHYYSVTLPDEQLRLELTGLSHSAIMRVTPLADGPLTITIEANSDEMEGKVAVDRERHEVYGYNPVHRIYQGWGESAGFSGHFVMAFNDTLMAVEEHGQTVSLTFRGIRNRPVVLRMATSFTNREGAEKNLMAEAAHLSFEQMEQQCLDRWIQQLHTIDIDDPDTARVTQFYGALYRASFLPREMSDVDGSYPIFGGHSSPLEGMTNVVTPKGGVGKTRYGDFSLWDTYRALHPLLCIIAPKESGQMMQSLVDMAQEGSWMPIFPCWNSYTAAMIGDHASSVLADAYVKGVGGFDAATAYRYLRKNAFEKPHSIEEYQNGMGRRALDSYLKYGYLPLEDSVKEAFHQQEQTSRTLEYAYDDYCVAQLARGLQASGSGLQASYDLEADYRELMRRSENWRNVINPATGWADGRYAPKRVKSRHAKRNAEEGLWLGNTDLTSRQPYITEGAVCHYTWYVPQNIGGLIELMGGEEAFTARLDSMFSEGRYWHGNEPCHQVAWLYSLAGRSEKTRQQVSRILQTEYNDTPGGLSGNDDAGQMSAWQVFANLGFYPVCPGTADYVLGGAQFRQVTVNQPGCKPFIIRCSPDGQYRLNGQPLLRPVMTHSQLLQGGVLDLPSCLSRAWK